MEGVLLWRPKYDSRSWFETLTSLLGIKIDKAFQIIILFLVKLLKPY
jgi:hypothetical protein